MRWQALWGQRDAARARAAAGAVQAVARKVVQQGQGTERVAARCDGRLVVMRVREQQAALRGQEAQRTRRHGLHGDGALLVGRRDRQRQLQGRLLPLVARHEAHAAALALASRALGGPGHDDGGGALPRLNTNALKWFEKRL